MPHARTPCNSVLGVYNSCKWNCQFCACVNRSQVVIDNQPETLVAETLGMRLVILVQEPISGNETRFMCCHCMQNCLSSSMTVCLRMWTGRGTRARTQELSATFSSCGQCRLSSEWTRVIKTGWRFDTTDLNNICQAACIWQFPEISLPVNRTTMLRRMLDSLELALLPSPSPLSHMAPIMQSDHKLGSKSYKPLLARPTAGDHHSITVMKGSNKTLMSLSVRPVCGGFRILIHVLL